MRTRVDFDDSNLAAPSRAPFTRYSIITTTFCCALLAQPVAVALRSTRTKPVTLDNPLCHSTLYNNRSIALCLPLLACLPACLACLLTASCLFLCHINHLVRLLLAAASIACIALTVPIALAAIPSIINTAALLLFCNGLVRRGTLRLPSLLLDVL